MIEKYTFDEDLNVLGIEVTTFPNGIGEVFDSLSKLLPDELKSSYYGISKMEGDHITYIAAAGEKNEDEARIYRCNKYVIEQGDYLIIKVNDWGKKTDSIKDIFHQLMQDNRTDKSKPCVEWYKTDEEMLCMMKATKPELL